MPQIKNRNLSAFGKRLLDLMGTQSASELAEALYDQKLVAVTARKQPLSGFERRKSAIGSIEKKIRTHLKAKSADRLQGEFVRAYCLYFNVSADYLFGLVKIKSGDIEIRRMCERTGLSEQAIINLCNTTGKRSLMHELGERQQAISRFFESPFLGEFFDCLVDAVSISDQLALSGNAVYDNLVDNYGEEIAVSAVKALQFGPVDESDTAENKDETVIQAAVKELNVSIDMSRNDEYALKVAKYELRETFETLIRNIL